MADNSYALLWLITALLVYGWVRFLLYKIFNRPVFEKLDRMIVFIDKFFPTGLVQIFFDIFHWTH